MININNAGSVLILLVVMIAVITTLGLTSLNITMSQFQIKKTNSGVKKAFYVSEGGLNNAYLQVFDLIGEATSDSFGKSEKYLLENPEDTIGAADLFYNNYRQFIINKIRNRVYNNSNPYVEITNTSLMFKQNILAIRVSSKYITEWGIEKTTAADITISVPDYMQAKLGLIDIKELIKIKNFEF